jgi:hypothetical protein
VTSLPLWFPFALTPVLATVLVFAFRQLFSLDSSLSAAPGVVIIQPRTAKHVYEFLLMLLASTAVTYGCVVFSAGRTGAHWWLIPGVVFAIISGFIANAHLWLDNDAMHYRIGFFRVVSIQWPHLNHYEIQRVIGRGGSSYYYLFRSNDDKTIYVAKSNYNIDDLLQKIRAHTSVSERPYKP